MSKIGSLLQKHESLQNKYEFVAGAALAYGLSQTKPFKAFLEKVGYYLTEKKLDREQKNLKKLKQQYRDLKWVNKGKPEDIARVGKELGKTKVRIKALEKELADKKAKASDQYKKEKEKLAKEKAKNK